VKNVFVEKIARDLIAINKAMAIYIVQ